MTVAQVMADLKGFVTALVLVVVVVVCCSPTTQAARILISVIIPVNSSHAHGVSTVSKALVEAGHDVTILTSSSVGTKGFSRGSFSRALQFHFDDTVIDIQAEAKVFFNSLFTGGIGAISSISTIMDIYMFACQCLLDDHATLSTLKSSAFDVVIGDVFNGCNALLKSYLDIPLIALTTSARYPFFDEHVFGIPAPSSYVPFGTFSISDKMSFSNRLASFLEHNVLRATIKAVHYRKLRQLQDEKGLAPGRDVRDILAKAKLWLCMTSFAFDTPKPLAPNKIHIGGIANTPAKPLNKEYADFVEGSGDHGFIIFSLGTFFAEFPEPRFAEHFAQAFSRVQQRVIWRYKGPRPHHLGNNTKLVDWLPQNDLLGHPKARLLFGHGGMHGIYEAIYHGVPMVAMPIFAEQHGNAAAVEARGIGKVLDKETLTANSVLETVKEVLDNPQYSERIRHYSEIHRDTLAKPAETAVFWVEHVLKYGGSHLRLRSSDLTTIQLYSLDVIAFIGACILAIGFILISCCRCCVTRCCKTRKSKSD